MSALEDLINNNKIREKNAKKRENNLLKLDYNDLMANGALVQILMYLAKRTANSYKARLEKDEEKQDLFEAIREILKENKKLQKEYADTDEFADKLKSVLKEKMPNLSDESLNEFKAQCKEVLENDNVKLDAKFFLKDREIKKEIQKDKQTEHNRNKASHNRQRQ
ncbi:TPA: hypothetical protein RPW20_000711 [Campylobacter fetus subsp. venerealis]|nr:hypothetical protein [Campylobacter fetus subsp. venerealis]HDX6324066.1 hypothetical protein [Campylobacter fetus subsp. venerealis]